MQVKIMNKLKEDQLIEAVKSGDTDFQSVEELKEIIKAAESYRKIASALDEENDINVILSALSSILEFDVNELKALDAALEYYGYDLKVTTEKIKNNEYILLQDVDEDDELGQFYCDEGFYTIPDWLENYIDYDSFGRDIRLNSQGFFSDYVWFEWL